MHKIIGRKVIVKTKDLFKTIFEFLYPMFTALFLLPIAAEGGMLLARVFEPGRYYSSSSSTWSILLLLSYIFFLGITVRYYFFRSGILSSPALVGASSVLSSEAFDLAKMRASLTPEEVFDSDRIGVISDISSRIDSLKVRTRNILGAMAVALLAAAGIVLFAGTLTSIDASAVSDVDKIQTQLDSMTQKLQDLDDTENRYKSLQTAISSNNKAEVDRIRKLMDQTLAPGGASDVSDQIGVMKVEIGKLDNLLDKAWQKELSLEKGNRDWKFIIATAITRIGVVLIIVYLVQILMGFYRYNTRMIAYYNSRSDLLTLWSGKERDYKELEDILTPSKIDFGKEPKHPLADIVQAVRDSVSSAMAAKSAAVPITPPL